MEFAFQSAPRSSEADTRAKLIDPALHARGWTEELIRREETAGAVQIIDGKPRKQAKGRVDYTLRIKVNPDTQPVAVAVLEAKPEHLPPTHGLEQAKVYAACKRLNVPFAFSSNGHIHEQAANNLCRGPSHRVQNCLTGELIGAHGSRPLAARNPASRTPGAFRASAQRGASGQYPFAKCRGRLSERSLIMLSRF